MSLRELPAEQTVETMKLGILQGTFTKSIAEHFRSCEDRRGLRPETRCSLTNTFLLPIFKAKRFPEVYTNLSFNAMAPSPTFC